MKAKQGSGQGGRQWLGCWLGGLLLLASGQGWGDGLIFRLPVDGTWATFEARSQGRMQLSPLQPAQTLDLVSTVTVRSVGRVVRHDQACRWIELEQDNAARPGIYPKLVLKMLIPERELARGHDPLAHALQTFFNPKPVDGTAGGLNSFIAQGFNRIQYEIDRFRGPFPLPLEGEAKLDAATVNAGGRAWADCERIKGLTHYDGPSLGGRIVTSGTMEITLHPEAPFGVVAMHSTMQDREYAGNASMAILIETKLTLIKWGTGALSTLEPLKGAVVTTSGTQALLPLPASPELKAAYAAIAEVERCMRAHDGEGIQKILLFGETPQERRNRDAFVKTVNDGQQATVRLQPLAGQVEKPLAVVMVDWTIPVTEQAPLRQTVFVVQRDGHARVLMGMPAAAMKGVLMPEEQEAYGVLSAWAVGWKKEHPIKVGGKEALGKP